MRRRLLPDFSVLTDKLRESAASVLPITLIVLGLGLFLVPLDCALMLAFLLGSAMLVLGMALFTLGCDRSMTEIGAQIGARMTRSKNVGLILGLSFVLGVAITVAEPDLQVLAANVPAVGTDTLIWVVSAGVGLFLMAAMLRILFAVPIKYFLIACYGAVFLLACFVDRGFLSVAFDAGGVTTGPMTVPFIMALGLGVASIRSDGNAESDGFGLVALCSVGPILAVMALGFLYPAEEALETGLSLSAAADTTAIGFDYLTAFPTYLFEVAKALAPIFAFFTLFQLATRTVRPRAFLGILVGVLLTYVGLVLFLTGVNVGFSPLGLSLGARIAESEGRLWLIPLGALMGWFIINAEPAVHVLNRQVEELSAGAISARAMGLSLSLGIALANAMAMIRVLTGLSILWFLVPGYALSLILALFVPQTFTAIAFDSGGVASGPMTATFMLPFAMGACEACGGSVMTDAFGLVALVAMMPLITVQIMGAISTAKSRRAVPLIEAAADDEIIELWETA